MVIRDENGSRNFGIGRNTSLSTGRHSACNVIKPFNLITDMLLKFETKHFKTRKRILHFFNFQELWTSNVPTQNKKYLLFTKFSLPVDLSNVSSTNTAVDGIGDYHRTTPTRRKTNALLRNKFPNQISANTRKTH